MSADFCAEQIDVLTIFTVITNVVIKRVQCSTKWTFLYYMNIPTYSAKIVDDKTCQNLKKSFW